MYKTSIKAKNGKTAYINEWSGPVSTETQEKALIIKVLLQGMDKNQKMKFWAAFFEKWEKFIFEIVENFYETFEVTTEKIEK